MSLVLSLGSNIGDKLSNLDLARQQLTNRFELVASSRIYVSKAVDYTEQPDFFNQVLEFNLPNKLPREVIEEILEIERTIGRVRIISKGPRVIDIDILFWGEMVINEEKLTIPHPRWKQRSFVVIPLKEIPYYSKISDQINIPKEFYNLALPINE